METEFIVMQRHRTGPTLAALALAVLLAGCGMHGGKKQEVASVADASSTAAAAGTATAGSGPAPASEESERWLQFSGCLRDNGLDVQDPAISGGLPGLRNQTGDRAKRKAAIAACAQYAPPGVHGAGMSEQDRQKMLTYTQCLRDRGVQISDPDPATGLPQRADREKFRNPDATMLAAQKACLSKLPAGFGGSQ
jgi:hypothetical protein